MVAGPLKSLISYAATVGVLAGALAGNAIAQQTRDYGQVKTVVASDEQNTAQRSDRDFVIVYNPTSKNFSQSALDGTVSDIRGAGCDKIALETKPFGSMYTLQVPWFNGGSIFNVDDMGTVGTIGTTLCKDGELEYSGPS